MVTDLALKLPVVSGQQLTDHLLAITKSMRVSSLSARVR